ncbi:MAG: hypothetical protein A3K41_16460 [Chloroflexi bacterium RIFOXYD12_FULL_57_15]|nr:MAG: hypothetical protein A3K41_16460 [Chloroflexi bacterium RIFOXYD12_FULL_57_15]
MTNAVSSIANEAQLIRYAEKIVSPLIREGVFENFERALRALLLDYIDRQIANYKNKNAELEARYKQKFDSFTVSLKNHAAPDQEDAWMDWETALVFLRKWQTIREQVTNNGAA